MSLHFGLIGATAVLMVWAIARARTRERATLETLRENVSAGLTEPPSLHPVIDVGKCIGCGGCVSACPEGSVLGLVDGHAELVEPTTCIGHGACKAACPADAIDLVFGTATRGIDLPVVGPDFQTAVPGIFIAGELGGMGLIRNAIEQGRQAVASIRRLPGIAAGTALDLVVVGAGPAGLAASLAAREAGLRFVTLEQDSVGGTIAHYPRGKIVMTRPAVLPIAGKMPFRETTKEELVKFWSNVVERADLPLRSGERVTGVRRDGEGLLVTTGSNRYRTHAVLLAVGRRGTPRKLGVAGEDLPKVVYRLEDPETYRGRRVLIVGGGDSAIEAAVALAGQRGTEVTLCHRSDAFDRARPANRARIEDLARGRRVHVARRSKVLEIAPDHVRLDVDGRERVVGNDAVVVCAGGILPTAFLREIGVEVRTHHGAAD